MSIGGRGLVGRLLPPIVPGTDAGRLPAFKSMRHANIQISTFWNALREDEGLARHATIYTWSAARMGAGRVLDLGGEYGIGSLLIAEANSELEVVNMDIDLATLGYLRGGHEHRRTKRINAEAHRLPVASGSFSGICLIHLLHIIGETSGVLSEAWRVLKPGGMAVISIPGESAWSDSPEGPALIRQLAAGIARWFVDVLSPSQISGSIPSLPPRTFAVNQPTLPWVVLCHKNPVPEKAMAF